MNKKNDSTHLPQARPREQFVVEVLADEVLVYDRTQHAAHCLTPAAALVWERCDGRTSRADAAAALVAAGSKDSLDAVLAQLSAAALVIAPSVAPARAPRDSVSASRRRLLGKSLVAAGVVLASPVVYSIIAPSVAQAASTGVCGNSGQPCCTTLPLCKRPSVCNNILNPSAGTCQ